MTGIDYKAVKEKPKNMCDTPRRKKKYRGQGRWGRKADS